MTRPMSARAAAVLTSGAATTLYYATPDFIPSRTARGWAKGAVTAAALVTTLPDLRAAWAEARDGLGASGTLPSFASLPVRSRAVLVATGAAALAASLCGVVAAERRAFRHGQARAAAGKRWPHTGPAVLYGALMVGLGMLPVPSSDDAIRT